MKLKSHGRHFELPIIGFRFAELRLAIDRLVEIHFRDACGNVASLTLEESLTVDKGSHSSEYEGSKPGKSFAPQMLAPLADSLGCTVLHALAQIDGTIRIALSDKTEFSVAPTSGYEGWHFKFTDDCSNSFEVHGATGHLIR